MDFSRWVKDYYYVYFLILIISVSGCATGEFANNDVLEEFDEISKSFEEVDNFEKASTNDVGLNNANKSIVKNVKSISKEVPTDCEVGCAYFSEVYFNTDNGSFPEYLIIKNNHDSDIKLIGWSISDKSGREYVFGSTLLENRLVIAYDSSHYDCSDIDYTIALNNENEEIVLKDADGDVIDNVSWKSGEKNKSIIRNSLSDKFYPAGNNPCSSEDDDPIEEIIETPEIDNQTEQANGQTDESNNQTEQAESDSDTTEEAVEEEITEDEQSESTGDEQTESETDSDTNEEADEEQEESEVTEPTDTVVLEKAEIVEVFYNPEGRSEKREYVVIKNLLDEDLNIENWSFKYGETVKRISNEIEDPEEWIISDEKLFSRSGDCGTKFVFILSNTDGSFELLDENDNVVDSVVFGNGTENNIKEDFAMKKVNGSWTEEEPEC